MHMIQHCFPYLSHPLFPRLHPQMCSLWLCLHCCPADKFISNTGLEKISFHSIPKKDNAKEHSNYCTIALISNTGKVMLKILQARLHLYMNWELPDVQNFQMFLDLEKAEEPEIKLPTSVGSLKKQESSRKTSTSALLTMPALTVWITTNSGKFLKRWDYQTILPASWEICMQVKKQQLEQDMEQWTGSKSGKKYVKAVYYHPAYLTPMRTTSCEMPGWMKHKLESRFQEKYQ